MFRFTIRDVIWLTALVAALVAWGLDHTLQALQVRQLKVKADGYEQAALGVSDSLVEAAHYIARLKQDSGASDPNDPIWKALHESNK